MTEVISNTLAGVDDYSAESVNVRTRAAWQSSWNTQPRIKPISLHWPTGGIATAELEYVYGEVEPVPDVEPDSLALSPLEVMRHFVEIEIENPPGLFGHRRWIGIVTKSTLSDWPTSGATVYNTLPTGKQTLRVRGIEWLLSRVQITESVVLNNSYDATSEHPQNVHTMRVGRGITFNAFRDDISTRRRQTANRSANKTADSYVFCDLFEDAKNWKASQILEYLFFHFPIGDGNLPPFTLKNPDMLDWNEPTVRVHGRTLLDVLGELAHPRRGLTWNCQYKELDDPDPGDPERFEIEFVSFSPVDVTLPNGETYKKSDHLYSALDLRNQWACNVTYSTDSEPKYEQVIAEGARYGAIFSVGFDDTADVGEPVLAVPILKSSWSNDEEQAYVDGLSNDGNYDSFSLSDKERLNDLVRRNQYPFVYSRFQFDLEWWASSAMGGHVSKAIPLFNYQNHPWGDDEPEYLATWNPGLRVNNYLPLLSGYSYHTGEPTKQIEDATYTPGWRRPFAVYQLPEDGRWVYAHELSQSQAANELVGRNGYTWQSLVYPDEHNFGFHIRPSVLPHVHRAEPPDTLAEPSAVKPQIDYKKSIVTLYVQADDHVREKWPDMPNNPISNMQSTLFLRLHDYAYVDFLHDGTVTDVDDDGQLLRVDSASEEKGYYVRDDRDFLKSVARMAYQWYGRERHAVRMTFRWVVPSFIFDTGPTVERFPLGALIQNLSGFTSPINTVITSVNYDFVQGQTTMTTQFSRVDFATLVTPPDTGPRNIA